MKNKKGFTLIELLAVIVILAIIALITTPIVLNLINQSKEAANKRSVEAYAKAVEYAVVNYEYNHNGELPADFDAIKNDIEYSNSDVKCNVAINCDSKGSVELTGCQVGSYTNTYYKYSSMSGNKGAEKDEENAHEGDSSTSVACSGGSSVASNPYETDFSGSYVYESIGYTTSGNDGEWYTELNPEWNVYIRKSATSDDKEVCKVFSGGTVCIAPNMWESSNVHYDDDLDENIAEGYVAGKQEEFEAKGASCYLNNSDLSCDDDSGNGCDIDNSGSVYCGSSSGGNCYVLSSGGGYCN